MNTASNSYDLIVVGAGTAGSAAAQKCSQAGWRVAIVDDLGYGGTCALRGCDPKKLLRRGAEIIDAADLLTGKGIDPGGIRIDWPALSQHMRDYTAPLPASMEDALVGHGVETFHSAARFTGPNRLEIDGTPHHFGHALIATGARPRPLDFPGAEYLIDSTGFLYLDALPSRILFVGGGFVSFEFAHIAARAGASTVIVDHGPIPLRAFDPDLVELLTDRSTTIGIDIRRNTEIVSVQPAGDGFEVTLDQQGRQITIMTDLVVHGAGRQADLGRLDLEAAGVTHGPRGVQVAGHLQSTSNPCVYAAGDAADTPGAPLTPGRRVRRHRRCFEHD